MSAQSTETSSPIFIFASGQRCGSTLLQRFLCTHPDILIWGEHDGVLSKIFAQFERLHEWERLFGHHYHKYLETGVARNFIANMNPPKATIDQAQISFINAYWQAPAQALGKRIWGFKEVLYDAQVALQLRHLYPNAKVIFITRHAFKCFTSLLHEERLKPGETYVPLKEIWTRNRTIEALSYWIRINRSFLETPNLDDDWVFRLTYEQMTENPKATMHRLADWLQIDHQSFDFSIFDYKIYTDRHNGPDERPVIGWEDLNAEEYTLLTSEEVLHVSKLLNYDMPTPRRR